jgi:hypothetical protein
MNEGRGRGNDHHHAMIMANDHDHHDDDGSACLNNQIIIHNQDIYIFVKYLVSVNCFVFFIGDFFFFIFAFVTLSNIVI